MSKQVGRKIHEDQDYVLYNKNQARRRLSKNMAVGPWTIKEDQIYLAFLKDNRQLFECEFVRRSSRVFRKMACLIRRRNSQQCRSHHQKLMKHCNGKLQTLIDKLQSKLQKTKTKLKNHLELSKSVKEMPQPSKKINIDLFQSENVWHCVKWAESTGEVEVVLDLGGIGAW